MKRILLILAATLALVTAAVAQTTPGTFRELHVEAPQVTNQDPVLWNLTAVYRLGGDKADRTSTGSTVILGRLTKLFGSDKLSADVDLFAGFTLKSVAPVSALLVGVRYQLAREAKLHLSAGPIITQGLPSSWAVSAGLSVAFNVK